MSSSILTAHSIRTCEGELGSRADSTRIGARFIFLHPQPDPTIDSDCLDAIVRYVNLRDWSFAVVDLMELAGQSLTSREPLEMSNPTLKGISGLLRDLLQQMDEHVEVIRGP